ncbi:unnamed protein product, partial [Porites evermanni]
MDSNKFFTTFANSTNTSNATTGIERIPQLSVRSYQDDIAFVVAFCILALMIVFGNSLVIGAFQVNRRLRTASNMLLISLATADILIGTISVPLYVYVSVTNGYQLRTVHMIFDIICEVSSVLNLTAISLERCYALLYPIKHRNISKRSLLAVIFGVWVLASFAGSMVAIPVQTGVTGLIITVTFVFAPLIVILAVYGKIFRIARAHARGRGVSSFKKDLRIATTVAVVTGLFLICWTPFFGINFAFGLCSSSSIGCEVPTKKPLTLVVRIIKWLQYGNSVCNPIVYGLRNREFRQTFHKILLGWCDKRGPLYDSGNNANGNPHLQQQTPNRLVMPTLIDRRESNRREFGIQNRRIQP